MHRRPTRFSLALAALAALAAAGCFQDQPNSADDRDDLAGGGGMETTEGNLASLGTAPTGARVSLIPADFDPLQDTLPDSLTVLADSAGAYRFRGLAPGRYNLEAYLPAAGTRIFRPGVVIDTGDRTIPGTDTLAAPGSLQLIWEGTRRGVLMQIGRAFRLDLTDRNADSGGITLDSLPAGLLPPFLFIDTLDSASYPWTDSVRIVPGGQDSVPIRDEWAHEAALTLDTTNLPIDSLEGYPLLVRLASPEFPFHEAAPGGADLRFTTADGVVLPHAVESWDTVFGRAVIWVRLTHPPGGGFGSLRMYWGNPAYKGNPAAASQAGSVFGFVSDYTSVWHLQDILTGGAVSLTDAGPFALPTWAGGLTYEYPGLIGISQRFDGISAHAVATDASVDPDANPPRTAARFCVSAWIAPDTSARPAGSPAAAWSILSNWRESDSTGFKLDYVTNPSSVRLTLGFGGKVSVMDAYFSQDSSVRWHLVGATYDGSEAAMFVDGSQTSRAPAGPGDLPLPSREYYLGALAAAGPTIPMSGFFRGSLDEVRMFHARPRRAWLSVDFLTQQPGSGRVSFQKLR